MEEQTSEPQEKQELDDLEPTEDEADAVKGGQTDAAHAGEIDIES
jgi:hypothetical protein